MPFFLRPETEIPDGELVAMFQRPPEARERALRILAERESLRRKVQKFVRENFGNRHDAEDAWQEALIIADRQLRAGLYRGESSLDTWVCSIGKYFWLSELRRRRPELGIEIAPNESESSLDPAEIVAIAERQRILADALASMDEKCRELLDRYNLHFSARETREAMHAPDEQWVHRETERCRRKVLHWLQKRPELLDALNPFFST